MTAKRIFTLLAAIAVFTARASAIDFTVRPMGFMLLPLGEASSEAFTVGGGGGLLLDIDLYSLWPNPLGLGYSAGVEGAYAYAPLASGETGLSLLSGGAGLSLYYYPLSRLGLRLGGAFGLYRGEMETPTASWYYRAGAEIGFRFTPNFTLALSGGYKHYNNRSGGKTYGPDSGRDAAPAVLYQGMYAGLTAQITIESRRQESRGVSVEVQQDEAVYPAFLSMYQTNPAAALVIRNGESAEIQNVRVSFRAASYTSSEFPCGTVTRIGKGRAASISLYADFAPALLGFTESGRVVGEIIIRYSLLGSPREVTRSAAVAVHNRNVFPGWDAAALAAFVSPVSQEALEYAKAVTGMARTARRTGLNQNMQFGLWLFEGLRAGQLTVNADNSEQGTDNTPTIEVQYPAQTLAYKSGSKRDIGLLYAAALEAAGISAALVPLETDFITAIGLGIGAEAAATLFNGLDNLLIVNDEVWLPLAMGAVETGFTAAWKQAASLLGESFAAGTELDFIVLGEAWASYPPAPFPPFGARAALPDMAALGKSADAALDAYIASDIAPLIQAVQRQIQSAPTAALHNRLGLLQIRAGRAAEAKTAYERAAAMGSVPAMTNRGSLALTEKDFATAERWYKQALAAQPDNETALRGLERAQQK